MHDIISNLCTQERIYYQENLVLFHDFEWKKKIIQKDIY